MELSTSPRLKELNHVKELLTNRNDIEAKRYLQEMVGDTPSDGEVWLYLGIANRRLEDYDGAIKCFRNVVEKNPHKEEAWGLLTVTLLDLGRTKEAQETIKRAVVLNPNNEQIQFLKDNLIRVYSKFGPFF